MTVDVLIRCARLVLPEGEAAGDIAIADGRIVAIGPNAAEAARAEIDARGLVALPGAVDAHVHFNEPGRTDWEGWATGSRAVAAGGGTLVVEMPLNASPPTLDGAAFDVKRAAAESASVVDFALWGGLTPINLSCLDELAARGVVGFKAFMSGSGIDDFPAADDLTLYEGMLAAARLGLPVAVHAESDVITSRLAARAIAAGRSAPRDYLASRPVVAETEAISRAIHLAETTGCALHIVHVSSGAGAASIAEARSRGVDVTGETCPHYLVFTADDLERLGAVAKCAPPLRPQSDVDALWTALARGDLQYVASDHSPAPAAMKTGADFFKIWGGISGCQSLLALLLADGAARGFSLAAIANLVGAAPANRLRLAGKGMLAPGMDADVTLIEPDAEWTLTAADLQYRHRHSPYLGRRFRGAVRRTMLRGRTIWQDDRIVSGPCGQLVRPAPVA
ncbi:MAG: allantoinase AllB [Thermomicrobiales bacterium]|nr:allantoinase AllB [Thermomicrobiales bacterium]